ncbi:MAG TPA: VOC family protein [Chloroflexota bacterium]|nr:VOC family protein [Chloroflexota bacterium]
MTATMPAQPASRPTTRPPQRLFPCLAYQDAPAAIAWLGKAFGFEQMVAYTGPDGGIVHAELRLEGNVVMLGGERPDHYPVQSPATLGAPTQGVYVCVAAVDALWERAVAAGAAVVRPLADTHYGSREFSVRDPEGHVWSFGTYDPFAGH